jgi:hypothetical protein
MEKTWLSAPRTSPEYGIGVEEFIKFAVANSARNNRILCPCKLCGNRYWLVQNQVHEHLICEGFMSGYNSWIFHGESPGITPHNSDSHEDPDSEFVEHADTDEMA